MASHHHQSKSNSGFVPRRSNPTAIRSPAVAGNTSGHTYGSGRPRSLALYSPSSTSSVSNSSSYGGLLGLHSNVGSYGSDTSYLGSLSAYSSPRGYGSPSPISTYGGTTSGYGGLTLHNASSSSSLGLSSSPSRSSYYNSFLQTPVNHVHNGSSSSTNSRTPSRTSSFNRTLTTSRSSPLSSSLGSRSGSLASLASSTRSGSEGYVSGGDLSSHSSRLSSVASGRGDTSANAAKDGSENGEVDYKKLYEESLVENERLREKLKKTEEDLNDRKSQLDKLSVATAKNSLTEMEKRERRAMERKLSEMEEELKQLQKLKAENERLKAENRALTRVVSKLTNSANATK